MKLSITTENKIGITDDILTLLRQFNLDLLKLEVDDGKIYLQAPTTEKSVQRDFIAQTMKIDGVRWVNSIEMMPAAEQENLVNSLLASIPDAVLGINNKGQVAYANNKAKQTFKAHNDELMPRQLKDFFVDTDWQEKLDNAAASHLPVAVATIAGTMLLEVQSTRTPSGAMSGAMLQFRNQDKVMAGSLLMQGAETNSLDSLVGNSEMFNGLKQRLHSMAAVEAPLCLIGEAGSGKTTLAQACHKLSPRKNRLFTSIDCQTTKGEDLEKLLFGNKNRIGVLSLNQQGTLFLAHIEQLPQHLQGKLFKHLQQHKPAIICSTDKRLTYYRRQGLLTDELASYLDIMRLEVPPLRERRADIEPLARHFLTEFSQQISPPHSLSADALTQLKHYYWPGNIAQLRNTLYRAVILGRDRVIQTADLDMHSSVSLDADLAGMSLPQAVEEFEKHFLQQWYQKYPSSRKLAAQLGVSHTTIAQKIKKYQLSNQH